MRVGSLAFLVAVVAVVSAGCGGAHDTSKAPGPRLPGNEHYHSLLVDVGDAEHLWLGTHAGLYESRDGGRSWRAAGLEGRDVMNLARAKNGTLWATGHNVAATSADDGQTWVEVRPRGLPHLDIHGFTASRDVEGRLYAALAGEGIFLSENGGKSFTPLSREIGATVTALAVTLDGVVLAADTTKGLVADTDGDGRDWIELLDERVGGVAASLPVDQRLDKREHGRLLVATAEGVLVSENKGADWRQVISLDEGAGPVAWSPSDPAVGYAVGLGGALYRTSDRGASWKPVA